MRLSEGDRVCSMDVVKPDAQLLIVSAGGFAKRTPLSQFPVHGRGGSGVIAMRLTDKSGPIVAAKVVEGHEEVMVISSRGIILRTGVAGVSEQGRTAQGVSFMTPSRGDKVACIALLFPPDETPPVDNARRLLGDQLPLPANGAVQAADTAEDESLDEDEDEYEDDEEIEETEEDGDDEA